MTKLSLATSRKATVIAAAAFGASLSVGTAPAMAFGWFPFRLAPSLSAPAKPSVPVAAPAPAPTQRPTDVRDPSAPGQVTVTAITTTSATVSWGPAVDDTGIASYEAWFVGEDRRVVNGTSFGRSDLRPGTAYDIVVVAIDSVGKRSSAAVGRFETLAPTVPAVNTGAQIPVSSCPVQPASPVFARFFDYADYSPAPDGGFENGASGWKLTGGAGVQNGNETLGISAGSKSLSMPAGATATSPRFCVDESHPSFRFTVKSDSVRSGLDAMVLYRDSAGTLTDVQFTSSAADWDSVGDWMPSASSPLATRIPLLSSHPTASVQLMFSSRNRSLVGESQGAVSIDSVMVDPYRRG